MKRAKSIMILMLTAALVPLAAEGDGMTLSDRGIQVQVLRLEQVQRRDGSGPGWCDMVIALSNNLPHTVYQISVVGYFKDKDGFDASASVLCRNVPAGGRVRCDQRIDGESPLCTDYTGQHLTANTCLKESMTWCDGWNPFD